MKRTKRPEPHHLCVMAIRRKFSDEYKLEAVRLATQPGVTKSQVNQELGINANMLGRWVPTPAEPDLLA